MVEENLTVMQANDLSKEEFVERFAPLFQGQAGSPRKPTRGAPSPASTTSGARYRPQYPTPRGSVSWSSSAATPPIETALGEIGKISHLRLLDLVEPESGEAAPGGGTPLHGRSLNAIEQIGGGATHVRDVT